MTPLIETLIGLGIGLALGLVRPRNSTGLRELIKQDIELRDLLDATTDRDDSAREALTQSIRENAQKTIQEEPGWYDRWGSEWIMPLGVALFMGGISLRGAASRFEVTPETGLTIEAIALLAMLLGAPLLGTWGGRTFIPLVVQHFRTRKQRRNSR